MDGFRRDKIAGWEGVDPRRDRVEDQFYRAPRADRAAHRPLFPAGRPRECDRRERLRLRHLGGPSRGRSAHRVGKARQSGGRRAARLPPVLAVTLSLSRDPGDRTKCDLDFLAVHKPGGAAPTPTAARASAISSKTMSKPRRSAITAPFWSSTISPALARSRRAS